MLKVAVERAKRFIPQPVKEAVIGARRMARLVTASARVLPDFIIIGAMRCGTSSLHHTLTEHPQVLAALRKEVRFFDRHFERGLEWYRAHFPLAATRARHAERTGAALTGEASPQYLCHPLAPQRIAATLPQVRLVGLLRDPVERAWSHYRLSVRLGWERLPFAEALAREEERLAGETERMTRPGYRGHAYEAFSYVAQGRYDEHLTRWLARIPRERIMVICAEEMFAEPDRALATITEFLGLASWTPRYLPMNFGPRGAMPPELRSELRARLAPSVARLEELLGREMGWGE